jgi:hypothetical protein
MSEDNTKTEEELVINKQVTDQLDLDAPIDGLHGLSINDLADGMIDDTKHTFHKYVDNYVRLVPKMMANLADNFKEISVEEACNQVGNGNIHAVLQDGTTDLMKTKEDINDISFCCTYAVKIN